MPANSKKPAVVAARVGADLLDLRERAAQRADLVVGQQRRVLAVDDVVALEARGVRDVSCRWLPTFPLVAWTPWRPDPRSGRTGRGETCCYGAGCCLLECLDVLREGVDALRQLVDGLLRIGRGAIGERLDRASPAPRHESRPRRCCCRAPERRPWTWRLMRSMRSSSCDTRASVARPLRDPLDESSLAFMSA